MPALFSLAQPALLSLAQVVLRQITKLMPALFSLAQPVLLSLAQAVRTVQRQWQLQLQASGICRKRVRRNAPALLSLAQELRIQLQRRPWRKL